MCGPRWVQHLEILGFYIFPDYSVLLRWKMASVSNDTRPLLGGMTIYDSPGPGEGGGDINNDMTITILHNNIGTILHPAQYNYQLF